MKPKKATIPRITLRERRQLAAMERAEKFKTTVGYAMNTEMQRLRAKLR
jgi:hypothetical protein